MKRISTFLPVKQLFFVVLLFSSLSCSKKVYDFTAYQKGTILKSELDDGRALYLVQESYGNNISGNAFVHSGKALVKQFPFEITSAGSLNFYIGDHVFRGNVHPFKKGMDLIASLPPIPELSINKQQIDIVFGDIIGIKPACRGAENTQIFDSIVYIGDIQYGLAPGYYTSQPIDSIPLGDIEAYKKLILKDIRVTMGKRDSVPLLMDIYKPYDPSGTPKPVFMFIHGGGFFLGDKSNKLEQTLTDYLVKRGYVVISINYRLGSTIFGVRSVEKIIYSGIQDARAALRYITHNSEELGIDPHRIYIGGSSAGAIISLNTAFMDNDEIFKSAERRRIQNELGNINTSGNDLTDNYSIAGVISMWGAVVDLSIIDNRNADIPAVLFHGTADNIVPIDSGLPYQEELNSRLYNRISTNWKLYGSRSMHNHMKSLNMPAKLFTFEGYGHEPQRNKDGSYNDNIITILEETNNFMYRRNHSQLKNHAITGDDEIHPGSNTSFYEIKDIADARIQWFVDGGLIIGKKSNGIDVVWFDQDNDREGKVSVCIIDKSGNVENVELLVNVNSR